MHIIDGLIPLWQCVVYYLIVIVVGFFAVKWARNNLNERKIPLLAVLGAGIFAIQTVMIPIPLGTDLHIIGAAMVSILFLSPYAGFLVVTIVTIIQALIFGDGGVTTLGVNIINMAVIGGFLGYYLFKGLKPIITEIPAVYIASLLSIAVGAVASAFELYFAGKFPLELGLLSIGVPYLIVGIVGEGIVTTIVYVSIKNLRPDLISGNIDN